MNKKRSLPKARSLLRGTAFVALATFTTTLLIPSPYGFANSVYSKVRGGDPISALVRQTPDGRFMVPPELGLAEESFHGKSGKTVLFIQDAHDSLEAQENISRLIWHFVKKGEVHTVFEEGYEGALETDEYFGFIKDAELKRKVSYFFLDHLRIGGAEYAHINRTKDFQLIGADNIRLHRENIRQFRLSAAKREAITQDLMALSKEVRSLSVKRFPKELLEWLKLKGQFDQKKIDLFTYLERTLQLFASREFRGGSGQREGSQQVPTPVIQVPEFFRFMLEASTSKNPVVLNKVKHIDAREVYAALSRLEETIGNVYSKDHIDRELLGYSRILGLLERFNALEVTQEEYEAVKAGLKTFNTESLGRFVNESTGKPLVLSKQWERNVEDAIKFYGIAAARDHSLGNALEEHFLGGRPDKTLKAGGVQQDVAVLVYGGFHKENIKRILESLGISYVIVSPRITKPSPRHEAYYKELMTIGSFPFEGLMPPATATSPERIFENPAGRAEVRMIYDAVRLNPGVDGPLLERYLTAANSRFFRSDRAPEQGTGRAGARDRDQPRSEMRDETSRNEPVAPLYENLRNIDIVPMIRGFVKPWANKIFSLSVHANPKAIMADGINPGYVQNIIVALLAAATKERRSGGIDVELARGPMAPRLPGPSSARVLLRIITTVGTEKRDEDEALLSSLKPLLDSMSAVCAVVYETDPSLNLRKTVTLGFLSASGEGAKERRSEMRGQGDSPAEPIDRLEVFPADSRSARSIVDLKAKVEKFFSGQKNAVYYPGRSRFDRKQELSLILGPRDFHLCELLWLQPDLVGIKRSRDGVGYDLLMKILTPSTEKTDIAVDGKNSREVLKAVRRKVLSLAEVEFGQMMGPLSKRIRSLSKRGYSVSGTFSLVGRSRGNVLEMRPQIWLQCIYLTEDKYGETAFGGTDAQEKRIRLLASEVAGFSLDVAMENDSGSDAGNRSEIRAEGGQPAKHNSGAHLAAEKDGETRAPFSGDSDVGHAMTRRGLGMGLAGLLACGLSWADEAPGVTLTPEGKIAARELFRRILLKNGAPQVLNIRLFSNMIETGQVPRDRASGVVDLAATLRPQDSAQWQEFGSAAVAPGSGENDFLLPATLRNPMFSLLKENFRALWEVQRAAVFLQELFVVQSNGNRPRLFSLHSAIFYWDLPRLRDLEQKSKGSQAIRHNFDAMFERLVKIVGLPVALVNEAKNAAYVLEKGKNVALSGYRNKFEQGLRGDIDPERLLSLAQELALMLVRDIGNQEGNTERIALAAGKVAFVVVSTPDMLSGEVGHLLLDIVDKQASLPEYVHETIDALAQIVLNSGSDAEETRVHRVFFEVITSNVHNDLVKLYIKDAGDIQKWTRGDWKDRVDILRKNRKLFSALITRGTLPLNAGNAGGPSMQEVFQQLENQRIAENRAAADSDFIAHALGGYVAYTCFQNAKRNRERALRVFFRVVATPEGTLRPFTELPDGPREFLKRFEELLNDDSKRAGSIDRGHGSGSLGAVLTLGKFAGGSVPLRNGGIDKKTVERAEVRLPTEKGGLHALDVGNSGTILGLASSVVRAEMRSIRGAEELGTSQGNPRRVPFLGRLLDWLGSLFREDSFDRKVRGLPATSVAFLKTIEKLVVTANNKTSYAFPYDYRGSRKARLSGDRWKGDYFKILSLNKKGAREDWERNAGFLSIAPLSEDGYVDPQGVVRFEMKSFILYHRAEQGQGILSGFLLQLFGSRFQNAFMKVSHVANPETLREIIQRVFESAGDHQEFLGKYEGLREQFDEEIARTGGISDNLHERIMEFVEDAQKEISQDILTGIIKKTFLGKAVEKGGFSIGPVTIEHEIDEHGEPYLALDFTAQKVADFGNNMQLFEGSHSHRRTIENQGQGVVARSRSEMRPSSIRAADIVRNQGSIPAKIFKTGHVSTIHFDSMFNLKEPVVFVIEQSKIDNLSPEMFREILCLSKINKKNLHLVIPDAREGRFSQRVEALQTLAGVHYGSLPDVGKSSAVKVITFSGAGEKIEDLKARLGPMITGHTSAFFGLDQAGSFAVALLYAIQNIRRDQLAEKNGYLYDGAGWFTNKALETLWSAFTVIASSA